MVDQSRISERIKTITEKVEKIMECNENFTNTYEPEIDYTWKIYFNEQYFKERHERYINWIESIGKKNYYNSEEMDTKKIVDEAKNNYYNYSSLMSKDIGKPF